MLDVRTRPHKVENFEGMRLGSGDYVEHVDGALLIFTDKLIDTRAFVNFHLQTQEIDYVMKAFDLHADFS